MLVEIEVVRCRIVQYDIIPGIMGWSIAYTCAAGTRSVDSDGRL